VAGMGYSGSTLLGAILGQLDGFFYAGELAEAGRWLSRGGLCGCGEPIAACPTWHAIFGAAFPETGGVPDPSTLRIDPAGARARSVLRQQLRARGVLPPSPELDRRRAALGAVLGAIPSATGSRVVVDSSKSPGYGVLLGQMDGVELSVVHVVR